MYYDITDNMKWHHIYFGCTWTITLAMFVIAILCAVITNNAESVLEWRWADPRNVIAQIEEDWTTIPFVQIESFDYACPEGWDPVFEREWKGIEEGCKISWERKCRKCKSVGKNK